MQNYHLNFETTNVNHKTTTALKLGSLPFKTINKDTIFCKSTSEIQIICYLEIGLQTVFF